MEDLNIYIEHTNLKPDATHQDIIKLCEEAVEHKFYGVYQFNKDHKIVDIDEYMDVTGVILAATAPKK